jgi:hypothetical protein
MARWLIVLGLAATLGGCSTSSSIDVVNDTRRPIRVQASFKAAEWDEKSASIDAELQPKESIRVLDDVIAPMGELSVLIDGQRNQKAAIEGSSFPQSICLRVTDTGAWLDQGADDPGRFPRSALISCVAAPFVAIAIFFVLGLRRVSRSQSPPESTE